MPKGKTRAVGGCWLVVVSILGVTVAFAKDYDVREFGAKGDGRTKDTAAIQQAIDAAAAVGGGRVVLDGGTFLTAPITLKGGVELHVEVNAKLLGSPDLADYPNRTDIHHCEVNFCPRRRNASLIYAEECANVAISGRGTIDANGRAFVREKTDPNWTGYPYERTEEITKTLPRVVFFAGVKGVTVTDITLTGLPAGWGFWITDCDYVHFDRVKVLADVRFPNNDGIHLNCSRDVTVSNCILETGDDAIIVRANSSALRENRPCERVTVVNCTVKSWCSGIRLAWSNDGVIRNCTFSNIVMEDVTKGIAIQLPGAGGLDCGREPTHIENITFSNIIMDRVYTHPLVCMVDPRAKLTLMSAVRDIRFSHIHARSVGDPYIVGRKENCFENFQFDNCTFERIPKESLPLRWDRHGTSAWNLRENLPPTFAKGFVWDEVTAKSWPGITGIK